LQKTFRIRIAIVQGQTDAFTPVVPLSILGHFPRCGAAPVASAVANIVIVHVIISVVVVVVVVIVVNHIDRYGHHSAQL